MVKVYVRGKEHDVFAPRDRPFDDLLCVALVVDDEQRIRKVEQKAAVGKIITSVSATKRNNIV